jgi:hypothetical protein
MTNSASTGELVFNNSNGSDGAYELKIVEVSSLGEQTFTNTSVPISASDTHYIDYQNWNGSDPITILIDSGSNGTIDQVITVNNEANRFNTFLPFFRR